MRRRAALAFLILPLVASAQPADSVLAPVEVTAAPFALEPARAPLAIAVRTRSEAERLSAPALTADALGRGLPGVWISDRGNPSTGERVLVRGLGWRAAFGVRGTHVLLDGVPLTLPDGQTPLTVLDPALVGRVEAVRGPASTFWGSGSAGVLALSTDGAPGVRLRAIGGAYGTRKAEASVRQPTTGGRIAAWGSALRQDGYREHAAAEVYRGGASASASALGGTLSLVALGAWTPRAEAPGGVTPEQAAEDPRSTRAFVVQQDAHKRVGQGDLALSLSRPLGPVRLRATLAGGLRSLQNPIVPRVIELDRRTAGLRIVAEGGERLGWAVGAEAEGQRDDRLERSNDGGRPGDDVLTDQVETVRAGAVFGRLALPLTEALSATAALRADALAYRADPAGAPAAGRTITALSPSVGVSYRVVSDAGAATLYANASGALDAPTTTELGNRTDGAPGFNPELRPERTWGAEAGVRATRAVGDGVLGLDAAAFVAIADDLLLPFEVDDVTAYRNEGRARHVGVEAALSADALRLGPGALDGAVALTVASGTFLDGPGGSATPEGGQVPGFPPRLLTWTLTWASARLPIALGLDGEAAAGYAADSAGEQRTEGYAVLHVRLAAPNLSVGPARAAPFVALQNVADARYAGSVVVNAFGGRFVEPAAGRHLAAGVTLAFD